MLTISINQRNLLKHEISHHHIGSSDADRLVLMTAGDDGTANNGGIAKVVEAAVDVVMTCNPEADCLLDDVTNGVDVVDCRCDGRGAAEDCREDCADGAAEDCVDGTEDGAAEVVEDDRVTRSSIDWMNVTAVVNWAHLEH